VQVLPYDTLLSPGGRQAYRVRLYNAKGQFLREAPAGEVQFSVDGLGTIADDGEYTAPADARHECALVTCQVSGLTGKARVRIVPPLPWKFTFDDSPEVPLTWIGGRVRWEIRSAGADRYLAKKTLLPTPRDPNNKLGTRSFAWMGPIDLANYTIQADVRLTQDATGRVSDIGLINSGYQMTIRGLNKKLRLDSWASSDYRTSAQADFVPEIGAWYTLKLSVKPESDGTAAAVRGKVWRRGEAEPDRWTVEFVDAMPNLHGTPAFYGNTPEAEVYLDNLTVTPN
jgi:hypothetical protein